MRVLAGTHSTEHLTSGTKNPTNIRGMYILGLLVTSSQKLHCKKRVAVFPSPAWMSLTKLTLAGNYLIISNQGEFGKWHPVWDRKIAKLLLQCREQAPIGVLSMCGCVQWKLQRTACWPVKSCKAMSYSQLQSRGTNPNKRYRYNHARRDQSKL